MRSAVLFLLASFLSASSCCAEQQSPILTLLALPFPHLASVAVDSTDYLYVLNGSTLVEFNPPRTSVWTTDLSASLKSPVAVKVDTVGSIYVTDMKLGAVVVFDSEGEQSAVYDGLSGPGSDGEHLTPAGLALDEAGLLYVVDNSNSRVVVFDGHGNVTRYVNITGGGTSQQLVDVVVDSDGIVYVSDVGNGRIVALNQQNSTLNTEWFTGLSQPTGLAILSDSIYVADRSTNTTLVFNTAGLLQWRQTWSQLAPNWLAVNNAGDLFIADVAQSAVGVLTGLTLPGTILSVIDGQTQPLAVAISNTFLLLVVNSEPATLQAAQLDVSNHDYEVFSVTAVSARDPSGVAVSDVGNFACQTDDRTVNCYSLATGSLSFNITTALEVQYEKQAGTALSVAIDEYQLRIYVGVQYPYNSGSNIQVFNFAGIAVGSLDYGVNCPSALAVSPLNGALHIADTGNNRIVVANRQGVQLYTWTDFQQPSGVAVDSSGRVYVADTGTNRLLILDRRGNRLYEIEHDFDQPRSVAVDKLGRIIVADYNNDRLVVMQGIDATIQRGEQQLIERKQVEQDKQQLQVDRRERRHMRSIE